MPRSTFGASQISATSTLPTADDVDRGAGESQGKTTWTGKAEGEDYITITGLILHYLQNLRSLRSSDFESTNGCDRSGQRINLLLAGYSYGSLVLARLPPLSAIAQRFESAEVGSAAAEIVMRARTLAKATIQAVEVLHSPSSPRGRQLKPGDAATSPTHRIGASPITMGGEETDSSTRRKSRDSRRSMDIVRKSVDMPRRVKAHIKRQSTPVRTGKADEENQSPILKSPVEDEGQMQIETRYLIISPVLLPFTATLCSPGPPTSVFNMRRQSPSEANVGAQFLINPTLGVFGSSDGFSSSRKLRTWAEKQARGSKSLFEWQEVEGAGHFWREDGAMQMLQRRVSDWVKTGFT